MTAIQSRCTLAAVNVAMFVAALVVAVSGSTPSAAADPNQFPDLSSYAAVNAADYTTYHAYMTTGVQFSAPAGYRCRMSFTHKQNGAHVACWGTLPGTPNNYVGLDYMVGGSLVSSGFSTIDLSRMEEIQPVGGLPGGTVNPVVYKPLPTHSKVGYAGDGPLQTCAVDASMTACAITDQDRRHGFVLSPQGSWLF